MSDGLTVNVLFELEIEGEEDIWTQLLKLSEETKRVPEHVVFEVLVVTDVVSIDSDKVTEFLIKNYKQNMTLEESKTLAAASIIMVNEGTQDNDNVTISEIKSDTKQFNIINKNDIAKLVESAKQKYQTEKNW